MSSKGKKSHFTQDANEKLAKCNKSYLNTRNRSSPYL